MATVGPAVAHRRRRRRGFSTLELLISFALLTLALSLIAGMVVASQRQITRAGVALRDMPIALVSKQVRADVAAARGIGGWPIPAWQTVDLELIEGSGDRVIYRYTTGQLVRVRQSAVAPTAGGARVVLQDVVGFRWRRRDEGFRLAVEIEIDHRRVAPTIGTGGPNRPVPRTETLRLFLALRGGGGHTWW